jgi:chitodextrinase
VKKTKLTQPTNPTPLRNKKTNIKSSVKFQTENKLGLQSEQSNAAFTTRGLAGPTKVVAGGSLAVSKDVTASHLL